MTVTRRDSESQRLIDDGYLDEAPPPRRSGCSIFGWLALILVWVLW